MAAPSTFAANEIQQATGRDEVHVVPNGVDARFSDASPLDDSALARLGISRPLVLHAGGATERKNMPALISAWKLVLPDLPRGATMALAGPPHVSRSSAAAGVAGIRILGMVDDELMPGLFASADCVVVPSLYEGFGLPALQAMAAGSPVVASNCASLPEVCGDAALLVKPEPEPLADGIRRILSDGQLAAGLSQSGRARATRFTWAAAAEAYLRLYDTAVDRVRLVP